MDLQHIETADSTYSRGQFTDNQTYLLQEYTKPSLLGSRLTCLGSLHTAVISPDGSGASYSGQTPLCIDTGPGKLFMLRDKHTNAAWNPFAYDPDRESDNYSISYSTGSAEISSIYNKMSCTWTISAAQNNCELWTLHLQNLSAQTRYLALDISITPPSCAVGKMLTSASGRVITFGLEDNKQVTYLGCSLKPSLFHTCTADFQSANADLTSVSIDCGCESPLMGMCLDIEIPIEGEATVGFCFGSAETFGQAISEAERCSVVNHIRSEIQNVRQLWQRSCKAIECKSGDSAFDSLVSLWLPYELLTEWQCLQSFATGLSSTEVADVTRLVAPFARRVPQSRQTILDTASGIVSAGLYSADGRSIMALAPQETFWLPYSVYSYIRETGELDLLDICVYCSRSGNMQLKNICQRELRYYLEHAQQEKRVPHPAAHAAMDFFNIPIKSADTPDPKEVIFTERCGVFLKTILELSPTIAASSSVLSDWIPDYIQDSAGQMLCLYLALTSEARDRQASTADAAPWIRLLRTLDR